MINNSTAAVGLGDRATLQRPTPEPGRPKPFVPLDKDEKRLWLGVTANLARLGVLSKTDGNQLRRYVSYLAEWVRLKAAMDELHQKTGEKILETFASDAGARVYARLAREMTRCEANIKASEREFGLTPAARKNMIAVTNNITINNNVVPEDAKVVYDLGATR